MIINSNDAFVDNNYLFHLRNTNFHWNQFDFVEKKKGTRYYKFTGNKLQMKYVDKFNLPKEEKDDWIIARCKLRADQGLTFLSCYNRSFPRLLSQLTSQRNDTKMKESSQAEIISNARWLEQKTPLVYQIFSDTFLTCASLEGFVRWRTRLYTRAPCP